MEHIAIDMAKDEMSEAIKHFEVSLNSVRTGAANVNMLDGLEVEYYGSPTPIKALAGISVQEGKTIVIKPYDKGSLKDIEKALYKADLGITPMNDGTVIRLTVPPLTGEVRKEMCKKVGKYAEEAKVKVRNIRRDCNEVVKDDDEVTEDMEKSLLEDIQKLTNEATKKIDEIAKAKEAEVMKV